MASFAFSVKEAKQFDLVAFLSHLGHHPQRIKGQDYWYLSPLRQEKTASFKVNRKLNVWFDFGAGQGGNLVDFGVLYFNCPVKELLQKLSNMGLPEGLRVYQPARVSNPLIIPSPEAGEKKETPSSRITILDTGPLRSPALLRYLQDRAIPVDLAKAHCQEVRYSLYGKTFYAIGFPNNEGGYELRNLHFKGSSSPKTVTFINNQAPDIAVFEGFFNFLSFLAIRQNAPQSATNYLVLNSLSFFQKSRPVLEQYQQINLYLDRDKAGQTCTEQALAISNQYKDGSELYAGYKDCNQFLIARQTKVLKQMEDVGKARSIYQQFKKGPDNPLGEKKRRLR
jgi:hypothetical protein